MRPHVRPAMKEPIERLIEDLRLFEPSRQHRSKHVADSALASQLGQPERARCVLQLAWPDPEAILAPKQRAERGEVFRQACERVGHRRGVDTDPRPKSVSRLRPPGSSERVSSNTLCSASG